MEPILSICIPIYNRASHLERMLHRFLEDRELFQEKIHLMISDNASEEDLKSILLKYQKKGLQLDYYRQEYNIGPDKNFEFCFKCAKGKFTWLLGSDDIPVKGFIRRLIDILSIHDDIGLCHIDCYSGIQQRDILKLSSSLILEKIAYWITFISSNIVSSKIVSTVDFESAYSTNLIQVPVYIAAAMSSQNNVLIYERCFEEGDSQNNGGYNLFKVFVENLFAIYKPYVKGGKIDAGTFERMKKKTFIHFLYPYIYRLLIHKERSNFQLDHAWQILFHHYRTKPYFYIYVVRGFLGKLFRR